MHATVVTVKWLTLLAFWYCVVPGTSENNITKKADIEILGQSSTVGGTKSKENKVNQTSHESVGTKKSTIDKNPSLLDDVNEPKGKARKTLIPLEGVVFAKVKEVGGNKKLKLASHDKIFGNSVTEGRRRRMSRRIPLYPRWFSNQIPGLLGKKFARRYYRPFGNINKPARERHYITKGSRRDSVVLKSLPPEWSDADYRDEIPQRGNVEGEGKKEKKESSEHKEESSNESSVLATPQNVAQANENENIVELPDTPHDQKLPFLKDIPNEVMESLNPYEYSLSPNGKEEKLHAKGKHIAIIHDHEHSTSQIAPSEGDHDRGDEWMSYDSLPKHHYHRRKSNPCSKNPCLNHGKCHFSKHRKYKCECQDGFNGPICEHTQFTCHPNPCFNGGTCTMLQTGYFCTCRPGYRGQDCEALNACESSPCANNGVCQETADGFFCLCEHGFTGKTCGERVSLCNADTCKNGGTCKAILDEARFECLCPKNYGCWDCSCPLGGLAGLHAVNYDGSSHPTSNALTQKMIEGALHPLASSSDGTGIFQHELPIPHDSTAATVTLHDHDHLNPTVLHDTSVPAVSHDSDQLHHDTVIGHDGNHLGVDTSGIPIQVYPGGHNPVHVSTGEKPVVVTSTQNADTGVSALSATAVCPIGTCVNGASCVKGATGFICNCPPGFHGNDCSKPDLCKPNPCQNNGMCVQDGDENYKCVCPYGFKGLDCQHRLSCSAQPCRNGGICIETPDSYHCKCLTSYKGRNCSDALLCFPNPCLNQGSCTVKGNSYVCDCPAGYIGHNCDEKDVCQTNPCIHGKCYGTNGIALCNCSTGWMGQSCDAIDHCAHSPCSNGGTCVLSTDNFKCICPASYRGTTCEIEDPCHTNPCENDGICELAGNTYVCRCNSGYHGERCHLKSHCRPNPCHDHGECFESDVGFICECDPRYMGKYCEEERYCAENPCVNGGRCLEGEGTFHCECPFSYIGKTCDANVCDSRPCLNGGTCLATSNADGYSCECVFPYHGISCNEIDPCLANPCKNGGTCQSQLHNIHDGHLHGELHNIDPNEISIVGPLFSELNHHELNHIGDLHRTDDTHNDDHIDIISHEHDKDKDKWGDRWSHEDRNKDRWPHEDHVKDRWSHEDHAKDRWEHVDENKDHWHGDDDAKDRWAHDDDNKDRWPAGENVHLANHGASVHDLLSNLDYYTKHAHDHDEDLHSKHDAERYTKHPSDKDGKIHLLDLANEGHDINGAYHNHLSNEDIKHVKGSSRMKVDDYPHHEFRNEPYGYAKRTLSNWWKNVSQTLNFANGTINGDNLRKKSNIMRAAKRRLKTKTHHISHHKRDNIAAESPEKLDVIPTVMFNYRHPGDTVVFRRTMHELYVCQCPSGYLGAHCQRMS